MKACTSKREYGSPRLWSAKVDSQTSGMEMACGVCVCPNGRRLSPPTDPPIPLNGLPVRRVVWPRRPPPRRSKRGLVFPGRPCPGACSLRAIPGGRVCACLSVCLGRFRNRE